MNTTERASLDERRAILAGWVDEKLNDRVTGSGTVIGCGLCGHGVGRQ